MGIFRRTVSRRMEKVKARRRIPAYITESDGFNTLILSLAKSS